MELLTCPWEHCQIPQPLLPPQVSVLKASPGTVQQNLGSGCCPCLCHVTATPVPGHAPSSPSPSMASWTCPQLQASLDIPGLWLTPFTIPVPSLLFWLGAVGSCCVGKGSPTTVLGFQNTKFTSICNAKPLFI